MCFSTQLFAINVSLHVGGKGGAKGCDFQSAMRKTFGEENREQGRQSEAKEAKGGEK